MKKSCNYIVLSMVMSAIFLMVWLVPVAGMATGPRVTPSLFSPTTNEIFVVDFPPFVGPEVAGGGLHVEIIKAALQAGEIDAVITHLPLPRMVKYYLLQENAIAVLGRFLNLSEAEKKALVFIPISVMEERYFYYGPAHQEKLSWNGKLQNLKGYTYGASHEEDVTAYEAAGINIEHGSPRALLQKLLTEKVDFIRMPVLAVEWLLDKHFPNKKKDLIQMDPVAGEKPVFILFNKKHQQGEAAAAKFRNALSKIIEDGRYMKILTTYQEKEEMRQEHMKKLGQFSNK